jgi:hypothetical protein
MKQANIPVGAVAVVTFPPMRPGEEPQTSLVKFERGAIVKNHLTQVKLSRDRRAGDAYAISNRADAPLILTAQAYSRLNAFTGMSFITPDTIADEGGNRVPNPYLERADGTRHIVAVRIRKIGIVRNPMGNMVAIDLTVVLDLQGYYVQDLFAKWRGYRNEQPKAWGKLVEKAEQYPEEYKNQLVVDASPNTVLLVDLSELEVLNVEQERQQRQRFADRLAATIVERNIAKKFYGITQLPADGRVPVVGWRQVDRDLEEMARIVEQANAGKVSIGDEDLEIIRPEVETATADDVGASVAGDAEVAPESDDDEVPDVQAPAKIADPETDKFRKQFLRLIAKAKDESAVYAALGADGLDSSVCDDWTRDEWEKAVNIVGAQCLKEKQAEAKPKPKEAAPAKKGASGATGKQQSLVE